MTAWQPQHPYGAPADGVTISRPLAPQEIDHNARAMRRVALWPMFGIVFGAGWVVLMLLIGVMTDWWSTILIVMSVVWLLVFGFALAIGIPLGNVVAARRARHELGLSGLLTVTWNDAGMRIVAENLARSAAYPDIRRVRFTHGVVVLRLRLVSLWAPYLVALPADFAPDAAVKRIAASGGKVG